MLKGSEDQEWLRRLVASVRAPDLVLSLGNERASNLEPIAEFDSGGSIWRAGRYIGEVRYEERTLRIEPRFGLPSLLRWLGAIWGVRLTDSSGGAARQAGVWLWFVIAHLWAARFLAAAKHGLPFRRVDRVHYGRALRGRVLVRESALARAAGNEVLVSVARERTIDPVIGPILLAAYGRLAAVLRSYAGQREWLPERSRELIGDLQAACGESRLNVSDLGRSKIKYSPITENYRSLVDLSLSIIARRPHAPLSRGAGTGVLLDMAEIWELYVARLLHVGLPSLRVVHTGRAREHFQWLARSHSSDDKLGSLRPDILIKNTEQRCVAVADAKYKATRINSENRTGILTTDLYQMNAYLTGFGDAERRLDGFLIYPDDPEGEISRRLDLGNPWEVSSAPRRNLWFVSAHCREEISSDATGQQLAAIVRNATRDD